MIFLTQKRKITQKQKHTTLKKEMINIRQMKTVITKMKIMKMRLISKD